MNLTLKDYIQKVECWELKPEEVVSYYFEKANKLNWDIFAFVRFHPDYIEQNLSEFKQRPLKAAPIGIKDNILTKGYITSCASKMLENYIPPYSATCFQNLEKAWGLMIWKTNMDEFAMWSSTETSYFGKTKNPYWTDRIPWWSSWWSAAAVAADMVIAALWTDTGWSIRQPASLCGVVGVKPTYGRVSRYGVQAMASSLDQVWTLTKTVEDAIILLDSIAWNDPKDATSVAKNDRKSWYDILNLQNLKWFKIAVIKEFFWEGLEKNVKDKILEAIQKLGELGAEVSWINMPTINYALPIYYIVMPAEVSTNLARFDGIKFWYQEDTFDYENIYEYYASIRAKGFWDEVKRRIILGSYVLSAWYYDAYYLKAQKVRKKLKIEFDKIFQDYDVIVWPVSPSVAWKLWEKTDDPLKMYLSDIYTIPVNLAGLPAMSLPIGFVQDEGEQMPVGLHIIAWQWQENKMFAVGKVLEEKY